MTTRRRLTREEEQALVTRMLAGDMAARDELVLNYNGLITIIARRYVRPGTDTRDLQQESRLAILKLAPTFKPGRTPFAAFVRYTIHSACFQATAVRGGIVVVPLRVAAIRRKWCRAAEELANQLGRRPTNEEIRVAVDCPKSIAEHVITAGLERADKELDTICRDDRPDVDRTASARAENLLGQLDEFAANVLRARYGIAPYSPLSLTAAGRALGCSGSHVHRTAQRVIAQLASGV